MNLNKVVAALLVTSSLSACCTVMDGKSQKVQIKTNAPAMYTIKNDDGEQVAQGVAPATVTLKRGDAPYVVTMQRTDASQPTTGTINDNLNGWLWGNLITPLGLILDFAQGSAWDLDKDITINTMADVNNPNANALNTPHVAANTANPIVINNTVNNKQG
ncbi:hypothetical protein M5Y73_25855 [Citrobacter cronae]|uniref:hypothetical protein n=1 Tax=Citrobacter werkmanii TaxID=67827 RepID=UPI000B4199C4|nr:hypothetical protein [Citrobacter werkmanii]MCL5521605.1 hypothetical protein [Citrobacter cronae]RNW23671.1 hypothetical protein B9081_011620 [Citrobacter werkmanii]